MDKCCETQNLSKERLCKKNNAHVKVCKNCGQQFVKEYERIGSGLMMKFNKTKREAPDVQELL